MNAEQHEQHEQHEARDWMMLAMRVALYLLALGTIFTSTLIGEVAAATIITAIAVVVLVLLPTRMDTNRDTRDDADDRPFWRSDRVHVMIVVIAAALAFPLIELMCVRGGLWAYSGHGVSAHFVVPYDSLSSALIGPRVPLWLFPTWGLAALAIMDFSTTVKRLMALW